MEKPVIAYKYRIYCEQNYLNDFSTYFGKYACGEDDENELLSAQCLLFKFLVVVLFVCEPFMVVKAAVTTEWPFKCLWSKQLFKLKLVCCKVVVNLPFLSVSAFKFPFNLQPFCCKWLFFWFFTSFVNVFALIPGCLSLVCLVFSLLLLGIKSLNWKTILKTQIN